ncbi:MAG TPA: hypothetical protein VHH36_04890 [Candidatus Thermoplasmatota archaeon]|nr:hypothetical protein [Candidatus Thermoplasmatota archaeon]
MRGATWAAALLLVCMTLPALAPPAAAAGPVAKLGLDAGSASEARKLGAPPAYVSFWVGEWTSRSGWSALESMLRSAKEAGSTPVVYWYYWGDAISPSCVEWGCSDRTRSEWDSMTWALATRLRDVMGGAPSVVVLENEFNKNGITGSYASKFDGYLEGKAWTLGSISGVEVVLGLGGWGESEWKLFPRALAASDSVGFQVMRASTRDSESGYRGAADRIGGLVAAAKSVAPGKRQFLYDLALSSYPDSRWARIQDETLRAILDRRGEWPTLTGIVYRELRDNPSMGTSNYYGVAEQYWGLRTSSGGWKPAWSTWQRAAAPPPFEPAFSTGGGNAWWVQVRVASDQTVASVCASVDGGPCEALKLQSWGDWASSVHAPDGARVVFTATSSAGVKATSAAYAWPGGTPALDATFTPSGNDWWIQASVRSSSAITAVCATVDGGACQALKWQSWGAWAASIHAPEGSTVRLRATSHSGQVAWSPAYAWAP